ncbi:MAG: DUF5916 domain-containing protein [Pseudomonadota bacterium]
MPIHNVSSYLCLAAILVSGAASAQGARVSPEQRPRPQMQAIKLAVAPVLDGVIASDAAWAAITPTGDFTQVQPDEGMPSTQRTDVFVGYTDAAIYVGFIAYDERPQSIIVADSRRDSALDQTDSFQVVIDGLLDRQNGYLFGTNPAGVEYDAQIVKEGTGSFGSGGGGFNINWDGSWRVEARITDVGWSGEMKIPFSTLRYAGAPTQSWGINFQRNIRSNNEITYWAPLNRQRGIDRISEAGTLIDIAPPPRRNLQLTPYVLARRRTGGEADVTTGDEQVGFDLKYSLTPSLTFDATYNTDFAQVEVDDAVINLDRFGIFLPEKRPFFLENAGQFTVGDPQAVELFFSRRIGLLDGAPIPIEGGLRLSGKLGSRTNVGLLYMADEGVDAVAPQNDYAVARVNHELPNRSSVGALFVGRSGEPLAGSDSADENQTYALDGRWGVGDNLLFEGWVARTRTPGLTGDDLAFAAKMNYDSEKWSSRLNWTEVREDFNPEVGFLRRDDYRRGQFFILRRFRPENLFGLLEVRPHFAIQNFWDLDGFLETGFQHYDVHWEFKNGYRIDTGVNYLKDGLKDPFEIVDGVVVQPGTYSGNEGQLSFNTDLSRPVNFRVRINSGQRFGGDRTVLQPTVGVRFGETFNSELSIVHNEFDLPVAGGDFDVTLARLRLSYSFTPKILLQALIQYSEAADVLSTNLRLSMLRTANSGLFVVYNEFDERFPGAPPAGREIIVKYSYLFDVFR